MPQHYLQYRMDEKALSEILSHCECFDNTLWFANSEGEGLFLQVGIIGHENYDRAHKLRPRKIVYGRRWRIEQNTPTSEVVQTAFLAVEKALEHEVRELLTIEPNGYEGKLSAPFSCHQDISVIVATMRSLAVRETSCRFDNLRACAKRIMFGQRNIEVASILSYKDKFIVDVALGTPPVYRQMENELPEFNNLCLTLVLDSLQSSVFLHRLMDALIAKSRQLTREAFKFKGVARFSEKLDPAEVAKLSIDTRPYARDRRNSEFTAVFEKLNYDADESKVPYIGTGYLGNQNLKRIEAASDLEGHLPKQTPVDKAHIASDRSLSL